MPGAEPPIEEPELLERLAMDDREFAEYLQTLVAALPPRTYDAAALARAFEYPWQRPTGSYRLTPARVDLLERMSPAERDAAIGEYAAGTDERLPLLAIGSNGAPDVLARKLAHFPDPTDRSVLVLTGRLNDFDVGVAAQPAIYGSMPATLFASPGTAVRVAILWVTATQLTQLAWSELSYRLGSLHTRFEVDEGGAAFDEVLAFVSRFGAFCVDGEPVALAAVPADGRSAPALSQEEMLDAAAALAIGPGARAEALVRVVLEDYAGIVPRLADTVRRESRLLASDRWVPYQPQM